MLQLILLVINQVLAETEEKDDVLAAQKAKLEKDSELQEFNDNTNNDNGVSTLDLYHFIRSKS